MSELRAGRVDLVVVRWIFRPFNHGRGERARRLRIDESGKEKRGKTGSRTGYFAAPAYISFRRLPYSSRIGATA